MKIDLSSKTSEIYSLGSLVSAYPRLANLKYTMERSTNSEGRQLSCIISFAGSSEGLTDETHSVTFVGRNSIGESRVDYLVELYGMVIV